MFSAWIFNLIYSLWLNVFPLPTFIAISDIHLDSTNPNPIHYGQDTGQQLWARVLSELNHLIEIKSPKFIILLGDLPSHHFSASAHKKNINTVLTQMSADITLPVFYVYGNEDSLLVDYGAFNNGPSNLLSLDPAHYTATQGWPALNAHSDCSVSLHYACTYETTDPLPLEHASDMQYASKYNFYSAYPLGSAVPLRLIVLNSVIFSHKYKPLGSSLEPADKPRGVGSSLPKSVGSSLKNQLDQAQTEMDWLAEQLADANRKGEAVYLAMHIPVGADPYQGQGMWNNTLILKNGLTFQAAFLNLVGQYQHEIRIILSGHTHMNELRALYMNKHLINVDIGVPGISPIYGNNPAFNVFSYDNAYQLTESMTYYTTPTPGTWKNFAFKEGYGCRQHTTLFYCVKDHILPQLAKWETSSEEDNPYKTNYAVRSTRLNLSHTNWLNILKAIQVRPNSFH